MTTGTLQQIDRDHYLHPFTDSKRLHATGTQVVSAADNVYIWDSDGNRFLDAMAGLWCVNIGYGRRELVDAATAQLDRLPYYNSFFQSATPPAIELARTLSRVAPAGLDHVFFTNSGSEANDTVVRMVRHYWHIQGKPDKTVFIARNNAYHGSTVAAASLGGMAPMHAQGGLPIPDIVHIGQPYWYREGADSDPDDFGRTVAGQLQEAIQQIGEDRVAAFIAEPIQGAGGVIVPPGSYWPAIKDILSRHEILFVVDEVICGFGRMGEWFGSDYYDLQPDLMPIAKGLSSGYLPIGGVMVRDHIAGELIDKGGELAHGFTYSGHPAAAAVALENIRILEEENIIETVRETTAPYFNEAWRSLADHPLVGDVRSAGLLGAIELVRNKDKREFFTPEEHVGIVCRDACRRNGVISRAIRDSMIVCPPLIISERQIDEMTAGIRAALDQTLQIMP